MSIPTPLAKLLLKILVAIDGSKYSNKSSKHSLDLAKLSCAHLYTITVKAILGSDPLNKIDNLIESTKAHKSIHDLKSWFDNFNLQTSKRKKMFLKMENW